MNMQDDPTLILKFLHMTNYEYDGHDKLIPSAFEINSYDGKEVRNDICGDPEVNDDILDLYRFIAFRLKKDDINKEQFVKHFKKTITKICRHFNRQLILPYNLEICGNFDKVTGFFQPRKYEFTQLEPKRYIGDLVDGKKSKELILATNYNIKLTQDAVYFDEPLIITEKGQPKELGKCSGVEAIIDVISGRYNLYEVYGVHHGKNQLVGVCLLHKDYNFYSANWIDQFSYMIGKEPISYWMFGSKDVDFKEELIRVEKNIEGVEGSFDYEIRRNFGIIKCDFNRADDQKEDKDNNTLNLPRRATQFASLYLAKDINGNTIGLAFDTVGYPGRTHYNLLKSI